MNRNKRLTIIIMTAYIVLTLLLAASIVYSYYRLGVTDTIFHDAEPWIKLIVAGVPQMILIAKLTVLAFIGVKIVGSANYGQHMVMQQVKGVKR